MLTENHLYKTLRSPRPPSCTSRHEKCFGFLYPQQKLTWKMFAGRLQAGFRDSRNWSVWTNGAWVQAFLRVLSNSSNSLESISPAFKWNTRRTQTQNRVCYFHFGPNLSQNHVCSQISQNRGGFSSSGSDSSKKLLTFFVLVLCKFQCLVFETTFTLCFGVCTVSVKESSKLKVSETLLLCNVLALCSNYWLQRLEAMLLCRLRALFSSVHRA